MGPRGFWDEDLYIHAVKALVFDGLDSRLVQELFVLEIYVTPRRGRRRGFYGVSGAPMKYFETFLISLVTPLKFS